MSADWKTSPLPVARFWFTGRAIESLWFISRLAFRHSNLCLPANSLSYCKILRKTTLRRVENGASVIFECHLDAPPWLAVLAFAILTSACSDGPTSPSTIISVTVTCPSQLLVGQSLFCGGIANLAGGGSVDVSTDGVWSSSDANIATASLLGLIKGRSGGQVTISTVYRGVRGSAEVAVSHQDVLQCGNATAYQGDFKTGMTVTMFLQGFYGVESASSGQLSLQVNDQNGALVSTSSPLTVARGGDSFVISSTFTIPVGATLVCRTALLQIGATTLSSVPPFEPLRCIPITP